MDQKILIFKILIFFYLIIFCFNAFSLEIIKGKAKVIDGDTIHIGKNKIRLHGIDAPEINQNCFVDNKKWLCGKQSANALINLINLKKVECHSIDKDKYNRDIANCYVNNININKYMVKNGCAISYRYYSLKFVKEEETARKNKLGVWRGDFEDPYIFRKKNK